MKLKYILSLSLVSFSLFSSEISDKLLNAAKEGNLEEVSKLLDSGANINYEDDYGKTALIKAASNGHPEVVLFLLKKGAKVDILDEAALRKSVNQAKYDEDIDENTQDRYDSYLDIIKNLLKFGANPNFESKDENLILQQAASVGYTDNKVRSLEIVKILLQAGASPRYAHKDYNFKTETYKTVDDLIDSNKKQINSVLKEASKLRELFYNSVKTQDTYTTSSQNLLKKINSLKINDWQFGFLFNTLVDDIKDNGINDFKRVVLLTLLKKIYQQNPNMKVALSLVVLNGLRKASESSGFEENIPFWLARALDVRVRMKSGTTENIASLILSTK